MVIFKTNEIRISTKTADKRAAIQLARKIANDSEMLFEQLAEYKNMEIKGFPEPLNGALKDWLIKNRLRTLLDEQENSHSIELRASKNKIAELESAHERELKLQQSAYEGTIESLTELVSKTTIGNSVSSHNQSEMAFNRSAQP